ncbi:alanine dehydrogenase [Methanococcoides methylutens]|uniref:Alanine dehydrogenase n=1 Tax=Methanococcoides methylutens MM1 TaxID=1434104 RepID=A0A0E3X0D7_METMT|nr:alanine dehydrogenase [Methanococcoides methylutens]AKB85775.1 Ornithine cyclodeaminase [Methanococcoides methylutens MM1]
MDVLWLEQNDVRSLLDLSDAMDAVEKAFEQHGRKKVQMPSKSYLYFESHNGDLRTMPAYLEEQDVAGVKIVNVHPDNRQKGLPTVMALFVLNSTETGAPLAVMDASLLTDIRTGAAGGIAAKHLARPESSVLGLVGSGNQARTQLLAIANVFDLQEVKVYSAHEERAEQFKQEMECKSGCAITVCSSIEEVCDCDILVTVTPVRDPIVKSEWIKPGTHINAIGADATGKEELEASLLLRSRVVVDDMAQASHSGEVNVPLSGGVITADDICCELGEVIGGPKSGRLNNSDITIFDSTGLAIQDVATALLVYNAAKKKGVGKNLPIF